MSAATNPSYLPETVIINDPLVAVVCIAESNNKDDCQAKLKDYENILFVLNHIRKVNCVYQVESDGSEDEKKSEVNSKFVHLKQRIDNLDEIEKTKFVTLWKKEELISFCEKVVKLLESEDNGYDALIFVLTAYVEPKSMKTSKDLEYILDSYSSSLELKKVYDLFGKDQCKLDWKTFPLIFMVDRYCQKDDKQHPKWIDDTFIRLDMDGIGQFYQYYSSRNPLVAPKSSQEGGFLSMAIKEALSKKPKGKKKIVRTRVTHFFDDCGASIFAHAERTATPVDSIPDVPDFRDVSLGFWE